MWIKFASTKQLYLFENLTVPFGGFAKTFTTPRKRQAKRARRTWQKANYFPYPLEYPNFIVIWFQEQKLSNLSTLTLFWPDGDQETAKVP